MKRGQVCVLNVGEGDLKLSFDTTNKGEVARTKRLVTKLLRDGFVIVIQVGESDGEPLYKKVKRFDASTSEYIVMGEPSLSDQKASKPKEVRIPASRVQRSVAVARTSGGGGFDVINVADAVARARK